MQSVSTNSNHSHLEKFKVDAKDEIIYGAFAFLKGWMSPVPVKTQGEISINLNSQSGEIALKDLEISGPQGSNGDVSTLIKMQGSQKFSWVGSRVTENTFNIGGATQLELNSAPGGATFALQMPLALLDLVIPNLKFIDGKMILRGQIPLPPDVSSIQAKGDIERGTLYIRGVGQPIETFAQLLFNRQQLNFSGVRGDLGGGEVKVDGFYKIDLLKPAANLQIALNRAHVVIMDDIPADITGDLTLKGEELPIYWREECL